MNIGLLRIKFIWGAGKVIQARWWFGLCGFYEHAKGYPNSGLVFSVRGLLVLGLSLAVLGYIGASTALYLWLDRDKHNYVTYTDTLLWPLRREVIREKRGQAYVDEGIDDLKSQHWREAEMKLRVGIMRQPKALKARLALAEFYLLAQRRPQALRLLTEGLEAGPEYPGRRYLSNYFSLALQGEEYGLVHAAADRYLGGSEPLAEKERLWLLQQKLLVLLAEKNTARAMELLRSLPEDPFFNEQRVMAMLASGQPREAVVFLEQWRAKEGATGQILRLQVRAFREARQLERMEEALVDLRKLAPTDPTPYAYGIVQRAMAGGHTAADTGLDDYFLRFGANARSMLPLAPPLAEIGAVELLEEFITRLAEQGHDRRPALLLLAQAHLKNGQWEAATATVNRLRALGDAAAPGQSASMDLIAMLATVAGNPAEGPQVQLLDYVSRQMYPLRGYRMIIETLLKARRHEVALEVAVRAEKYYAGNASLLALKGEAQAALAEAAAQADRSPAPGEGEAQNSLLSEKGFFTRVDAAMAAGQWSEAQAAMRDVQLAKPDWLGSRQAELLTRQLRIASETRESLDMILAARLLQDGTLARTQLVIDFATGLHEKGATTDAIMLLREVLRKLPNHALARRLIAEWQKKPEPVPKATVEPAEPLVESPASEPVK